jgi:hypothetical protein
MAVHRIISSPHTSYSLRSYSEFFREALLVNPLLQSVQHPFSHILYSFPLQVGPKVVSAALNAFTHIDGLIINHGTLSPVTRVADANPEEWRTAFDVNFFSAVAFVCQPPLFLII